MLAFSGDSTAHGVDNNGTASFVELPGGKFVVTNHHVWHEFQSRRANDSSYRLALTSHGFALPLDFSDAEVVSECRDLDLCVLSYPPERIEAAGKEFCDVTNLPPQRACQGDDVSVTGYPGMRRSVEEMKSSEINTSVDILRHEAIILYLHAEAVSPRQGRLRFQNPNPEVVPLSDRPITEFRWGGMSGSLVYRLDPSAARFVPCGILHAAQDGLQGLFYATHLDFIQADGTILPP